MSPVCSFVRMSSTDKKVVNPPPLPRNVPPVLSARPEDPKTLCEPARDIVFDNGQVCTPDSSEEFILDAV